MLPFTYFFEKRIVTSLDKNGDIDIRQRGAYSVQPGVTSARIIATNNLFREYFLYEVRP